MSHRRGWQRVRQQRGLRDGLKKKKKKRERETVVWRCFWLPPARSSVQSQLRPVYIYGDSIYVLVQRWLCQTSTIQISFPGNQFRTFVGLFISFFGQRSFQTPNEQHPNWSNNEEIEIYTYQSQLLRLSHTIPMYQWIWNINWNLERLCQLRSYVKH